MIRTSKKLYSELPHILQKKVNNIQSSSGRFQTLKCVMLITKYFPVYAPLQLPPLFQIFLFQLCNKTWTGMRHGKWKNDLHKKLFRIYITYVFSTKAHFSFLLSTHKSIYSSSSAGCCLEKMEMRHQN